MKRFFWLLLLVLTLFLPHIVAGQTSIPYTLSFDTTGTSLIANYTGPLNDPRDIYALFTTQKGTYAFANGIATFTPPKEVLLNKITAAMVPSIVQGKGSTVIDGLNPGVDYMSTLAVKKSDGGYIYLLEKPISVRFGIQDKLYLDPLAFTATGDIMLVSGKIDPLKHPDYQDFAITLEYAPVGGINSIFSTDLATMPYGSTGTIAQGLKRNLDGTYYWRISGLTPSGTYYYRQIDTAPSGKMVVEVGKFFNDSRGVVVVGSSNDQKDFEKRSYRLLAPFPGLSVLLDPDLCQEKKLENPGSGQICDINDFLNYAFRLMIGVAAVVLVIRIMIEGFRYATSDIPGIKINSKDKLWQAIGGLLLALAAWIILNTINPKLVENDISIQSVNVTLEDPETFTSGGGTYTGGTVNGNVTKNISIYDTFLKSSCTKYNIDCTLAKAHMYAESGGDSNAESTFTNKKTGIIGHAYGLMQLTLPTFQAMGYDAAKIKDPATNIDAGIKYMSELKSTGCDGKSSNAICSTSEVTYRIAAYNGGSVANRVSNTCSGKTRWQCETNGGYLETRNYVQKVLANQKTLTEKGWGI